MIIPQFFFRRCSPCGIGLLLVMIAASGAYAQQQIAKETVTTRNDAAMQALLERRVSVSLDQVSLDRAIQSVAASANVRVVFRADDVKQYSKLITLELSDVPLSTALNRILAGTRLEVGPGSKTTLVIRNGSARERTQSGGTITGRVIDSATRKGIQGVSVAVPGTRIVVVTNDRGEFTLSGVPAGTHQISLRIFGYRPVTHTVTVDDGAQTTVRWMLMPAPTALTEVVTTATGDLARYKVGNSITSINVDSLIQIAPVKNLTDILDGGRVPGLIVSRSNGAPGAPARVRIRGISSINASNDPIIIVDGVRIYSEQTTTEEDANYSVLDRIDINTIDRIDVLKGASASAQYGSDAANGVIVITTKRGEAGRTRWTVRMDQQLTDQSGKFPDLYIREAQAVGGGKPGHVLLGEGDFVALHVFNLLKDPRTTVLGIGHRSNFAVSVSGGTQRLRYSLSGGRDENLGLLKMSDVDIALLRQYTGTAIPKWQRRPQQSSGLRGSSSIDFASSDALTFHLGNSWNSNRRTTTPYEMAYGVLQKSSYTDTTLVAGQIDDFRQRQIVNDLSSLNVLSARWLPTRFLNVSGDMGFQSISASKKNLLRRGDCSDIFGGSFACSNNLGYLELGRSPRTVVTMNLRTSTQLPQWLGVQLTPMLGINFLRNTSEDTRVKATELQMGSASVQGANTVTIGITEQQRRAFGVVLNVGVSLFNQRLFTSFGTRIDASSALGAQVRPTYPKLDLSYLVSEESWFPSSVSLLRMRLAYGHSAVQPDIGQTSRTYQAADGIQNGIIIPTLKISSIGNPHLRPERMTELEGGVDIGILEDRLTLSVTGYRKLSRDMLIRRDVPPSVGVISSFTTNLGSVSNQGIETGISVIPIDTDLIRWVFHSSISGNRNRLERIAPDFDQGIFGGFGNYISGDWLGYRYVVGYPIDGWWMRPVNTYSDRDGDGAIIESEIVRNDSTAFIGAPLPKYEMQFGSNLGLWRGRVTISLNGLFRGSMTQANLMGLSGPKFLPFRELNDPSTSLDAQAAVRSGYAFLRPVSSLQFSSMSILLEVPREIVSRFRASRMTVSLKADNLGVWTNYRGTDPNVNSSIVGSTNSDNGQLPMPRTWGMQVALSY